MPAKVQAYFVTLCIAEASLYQPGRDFQCLDGSQSIKFDAINDDFCDCSDGSDEPGMLQMTEDS